MKNFNLLNCPRGFTCVLLGSLLIGLSALPGCGGESAMDARRKEFRYTPERLATEVIGRMEITAQARQREPRVDGRTAAIQELEADRGGDGGRPNPNSIGAIVTDVVGKFRSMESFDDVTSETAQAARDSFMKSIESAEKLPSTMKTEFLKKLEDELPPLTDSDG